MTIWRPIPGFPHYEVSNAGEVRRIGRGSLKPIRISKGYLGVRLSEGGVAKTISIHKLVAAAFLPPRPSPEHTLDHEDRDRTNNEDWNLRWATPTEQLANAEVLRGSEVALSKLTEDDVRNARLLRVSGQSVKELAVRYGVTASVMSKAVRGLTWAHVK